MDLETIQQVRAASNGALAARDLVGLGRCLAPDYLVITSTNVRAIGRVASVERLVLEDAGRLIEAELFVPTNCVGGSYCQRRLPEVRS